MYKFKILLTVLIIVIVFPISVLGATFFNQLIQGKTPREAIEFLAEQIESLIGKTEIIEEKQGDLENSINENNLDIDNLKEENQRLKEQITDQQNQIYNQEQQRELDILCDEISQKGSLFLPTKQPIKELYETLVKQNSETFEEAYQTMVDGGAKVLAKDEYKVIWNQEKASRDDVLAKLKPYYDEYVANCI